MPVARYYTWDRAGRPITPARPIREVVERLKVAYPRSGPFSWYANDAHYQADFPQDHTPFSATGWPLVSPYPIIFATDIMHRPMEGVDCFALFNYWIAEARAGRMPWLKYLIWQAKIYDVRRSWVASSNSDHFDHIHMSTRTDFQNASLGSWSLVPGTTSEVDMDFNQNAKLDAVFNVFPTVKLDTDAVPDGKGSLQNFPVPLTATLARLEAKIDKLTSPTPSPVDLAAVRSIVREEINKTKLAG